MLKAEKITLGVFDNNPSAYCCYKAAGFKEVPMKEDIVFETLGEKWKCIELEVNLYTISHEFTHALIAHKGKGKGRKICSDKE